MISISQLEFQYPRSDFTLQIPQLEIAAQEKMAFVGASGCGKTTLLNLIAGISVPEQGTIVTAGSKVSSMSDAARRDFRISRIGMVFQQFELIDYLDLKHNILLPFYINQSLKVTSQIEDRAVQLAASMGLANKLSQRPPQLSQGEKQRGAICRSLITEPEIILADEPTGNLDPNNKTSIMKAITDQADRLGQTVVIVTHDMSILDGVDRTFDFDEFRRPNSASLLEPGSV